MYDQGQPPAAALRCADCGRELEDALILSCDHNLCLGCAADSLRRSELRNIKCAIECRLCKEITQVEPSSAAQLLDAHEASGDQRGGDSWRGPDSSYYKRSPAAATGTDADRADVWLRFTPCPTHPDEPVQFFCLTCESRCVCAECVVYGTHKGHEVMNVKKAFPLIKQKIEDLKVHIGSRMEELAKVEHRLEHQRRDVSDMVSAAKQQMARAFEEVRQRLAKKEYELMQQADAFVQDCFQAIDQRSNAARDISRHLRDTTDMMNHSMKKKDDVAVLNWFSDAKQEINSLVENVQMQRVLNEPVDDLTSGATLALDLGGVSHQIDQLQGIRVSGDAPARQLGALDSRPANGMAPGGAASASRGPGAGIPALASGTASHRGPGNY
mmetsp:Transcript_41720/g.90879  ORF Transcript_41720/g.90879 Transcript_41720/m.90879 type:complete len:384 (+) Transcript_41720:36-1187(+)